MRQRNLFYALAAMLLMGSCSEVSDMQQGGTDGTAPLAMTVSSGTSAPSMRAANGLYTAATGFDGGEQVKVYMETSSTGTGNAAYDVGVPYTSGTLKMSDLTLHSGETALAYPSETSGSVNIYGVYPAGSTATHTVSYDQTGNANYKASDLMYAKVPVSWTSVAEKYLLKPNLAFHHQLVKLKVTVLKSPEVNQVEAVLLHNVKRSVTVQSLTKSALKLNTATSADDGDGDEILIAGTEAASDQFERYEYACVFPAQNWDDGSFGAIDFLTITADGEKATYQVQKNFEGGYEYSLTINLCGPALNSTTTITDWVDFADCLVNPTKVKGGYFLIDDVTDQAYTGSDVTPTPDVVFVNPANMMHIPVTLGTDYTLRYLNNVELGMAIILAEGVTDSDYDGVMGMNSFMITGNDLALSYIGQIEDPFTYNRLEYKPTPVVVLGGRLLTAGTDYVYSYSDNINAGTATVTISPADGSDYINSNSMTFTIVPKNLSSSDVTFTVTPTKYIADGTEKTVTPTVTDTNNGSTVTLTSPDEYTADGVTQTDKGNYVATITGQGNYTGTKTATWEIRATEGNGERNDYEPHAAGDIVDAGDYIKVYTSATGGYRISKSDTSSSVQWSNDASRGTKEQWQAIFTACGGNANSGYSVLNDKVSASGISGWVAMSGYYWSCTEGSSVGAWSFNVDGWRNYRYTNYTLSVRTISAF